MSEAEARKKLSEYASELAALDEVTPDTGGDASKIEMLMVNLIQEVKEIRTDLSKDKAAYDTKIAHLEEENTQLRAIGYQRPTFPRANRFSHARVQCGDNGGSRWQFEAQG